MPFSKALPPTPKFLPGLRGFVGSATLVRRKGRGGGKHGMVGDMQTKAKKIAGNGSHTGARRSHAEHFYSFSINAKLC